jgi:PAS domain-containing protein
MIVSTARRVAEEDESVRPIDLAKLMIRLHGLANAFQTLTWLADERGERFLFNEKWLSFTGRRLDQELDKKWLENVHFGCANAKQLSRRVQVAQKG